MRQLFLKIFRSKILQPFWKWLHHISLIGMNYFGGASLKVSGEIPAIKWMKKRLESQNKIVVFDVGANTGEYSMLVDQIFEGKAEIYAFEPSGFTFQQLKNEVDLITQIRPVNLGIGMEKTKLQLFSGGRGRTTASVYNLKYKLHAFIDDFTESVQITSVDLFCNENNISSIDILKIDIEGHELAALYGSKEMISSKEIKFIQFEFGKCHIDAKVFFRDFFDFLSPNYKIFRIVSNGFYEIEKYSTELEVFQTSNFLAALKFNDSIFSK